MLRPLLGGQVGVCSHGGQLWQHFETCIGRRHKQFRRNGITNRICLRTQDFGCGTLLTLLSSGLITLHSRARWPHRDARFAALGAGRAHSLYASPPVRADYMYFSSQAARLHDGGTAVWSWSGTVLSSQANQMFFNFSADFVPPSDCRSTLLWPPRGWHSVGEPCLP
jgi:hypothetical protein